MRPGSGGTDGRFLWRGFNGGTVDLRLAWSSSSGQFQLYAWNGSGLVGLATGTDTGLAEDTWYHVELLWDGSANPHTYRWRIDGVDQPTPSTLAVVAGNITGCEFGDATNATHTRDDRFDNLVAGAPDSIAADIIGNTRYVLGYSPDGKGTHGITTTAVFFKDVGGTETELTDAGDTTSYQTIDDLPLSADSDHVLVKTKYTGTPTTPPAFSSVGAKAASAGAESPASAAPVGALEILIATTIAGGTVTLTANGGSAWTAISPQDVTGGEKLYVWWRIKEAGDSAPTVTPGSDHICCAIVAYTGVAKDGSPVVHNVAAGSEATSDTSFSFAPSSGSTEAQERAVVIYTSGADSNTGQAGTVTNASLTGIALRAEYQTNAGGGGGFAVADGVRAAAGAAGTWADTMGTATPKAYFNLWIRALPPATRPANTEYLDYTFGNSGETPAPDAVEGIVAIANDGSGASAFSTKISQGGTDVELFAATITSATQLYRRAIFTTKPTGGAWTDAAFDATTLRFGFTTDTDEEPRLHAAMLEALFTTPAGGGGQTVAISQVTETEAAQTLARISTLAVPQAVETNLAQALARAKVKALAQVTETSLAQAITRQHTRTLAQVLETELAQTILVRPLKALVTQVVVTNVAQTIGRVRTRAVAQATETDLAQTLGRISTAAVAQATETELAQTIGRISTRIVVQVAESDLAQAIARRKVKAIAQVVETETAQTISVTGNKIGTLTQALETDLAQTLARISTRAVVQVAETELAQTLGRLRTRAVTQVAEVDLAQTIGRAKRKALVQVTELGTAANFGGVRIVTAALETDLAQTLARISKTAIAQVVQTNVAQTLTRVHTRTITQPVETDTAQTISKRKRQALAQALEADLAQTISVTGNKIYTLAQAVQTNVAQTLARISTRLLPQAAETDTAQAVARRKTVTVPQTLELDLAQTLTALTRKAIVQALETDSVFTVGRKSTLTVPQVVETDTARSLTLRYILVPALETDTAQEIAIALPFVYLPGRPAAAVVRDDASVHTPVAGSRTSGGGVTVSRVEASVRASGT